MDFDDVHEESSSSALKIDWWRVPESPEAIFPLQSTTTNKSASACSRDEIQDILAMGNKLSTLLTIIGLSLNQGDKVLVFSQSVCNIDMIELVLKAPHWGILCGVEPSPNLKQKGFSFSEWRKDRDFVRIDGTVKDRQKLIDSFNKNDSSSKVFLISTKAGNMGINLQAANRVVLFDSSFNPVHDLQSIYRSFRYGQKKDVFVYRLLSRGSMEEKIYRAQVILWGFFLFLFFSVFEIFMNFE